MKKISEFIERIQSEKKEFFKKEIEEYEIQYQGTNYFDGDTLKIEDKRDVFVYFSEDKKTLSISYNDYDPRRVYSHLIYFNFCYYIGKYTNGGLKLIGFYDSNYKKVQEIQIGDFKIIGCITGSNFDEIRKPNVSFKLKHKDGNEHRSIRGDAFQPHTCQKALDSIWALEEFHKDFTERIIRSPEY